MILPHSCRGVTAVARGRSRIARRAVDPCYRRPVYELLSSRAIAQGSCLRGLIVACGLVLASACADQTQTDGTSAADDDAGESDGSGSDSTGDGDGDGDGDCERGLAVSQAEVALGFADTSMSIAACATQDLLVPVAAGSTLRVDVSSAAAVTVRIAFPDDPVTPAVLASKSITGTDYLDFESVRSGEWRVRVTPAIQNQPTTLGVELSCVAGCQAQTTRFPTVLVHGWTGFESIGPIEYFYQVLDTLEPDGYPLVVAVLDAYNSTVVRSEQLAPQIDTALSSWRARKVNLIAHSQGGLDSRRVISTLGYGDRIASLTTISTPHHGTPLADIALGLLPGDNALILDFMLGLVGASPQQSSDAEASFASMTTAYVDGEFNPQNPDDPRVRYFWFAGRTCLSLLECGDIVDAPISLGYTTLAVLAGLNDGVVPVSSAQWGEGSGTIDADHFDEVGQVAGDTGPNFSHLDFYRARLESLAALGL